ncbi:glycosyltransferase family 4 protein [Patescibacteria group bacterium]|nr:glycosyltransferase family 4 protein [Patescibacteria group bacterium]
MKLLIVSPIYSPEIGGPATYSRELLNRLIPEFDVRVISFGAKSVSDNRATIISKSGNTLTRQLNLFFACLRQGLWADLIYIQEPAVVGLVALTAGKILGKKIITKYVGDPAWEEGRRRGKILVSSTLEMFLQTEQKHQGLLYKITKLVLRRSDKVITPAFYLARLLEKYYQVPAKQLLVIPNSVEILSSQPQKVAEQIVVVGRLAPWKNVDLIIEAANKLVKKEVKFSLKIVGDGEERQRLESLVKKFGLSARICFLGDVLPDQSHEVIDKSEILVLFSDYEGLPHVALESFASKTVVVASNIAGTSEVVKDGETGLLVTPNNTDELARVLEKILSDTRQRRELANHALALTKRSYTWDNNLTKLKKLLYEVAAE